MILVKLTVKLFSEKMLISTRCKHGFMSNLIKRSWTDSILQSTLYSGGETHSVAETMNSVPLVYIELQKPVPTYNIFRLS